MLLGHLAGDDPDGLCLLLQARLSLEVCQFLADAACVVLPGQ
ncbi:hypothetical protein [Streptomyces rubradiris]|nr:hypothetical protein [Streptomyces rubradiris]